MKVKEKVFPCLSCGADTGCPNKLTCDKCRKIKTLRSKLVQDKKIKKKNNQFHRL